ncbi:MAG: hypothetical protein ACRC33_17610 [Gemmataceae bacterium]
MAATPHQKQAQQRKILYLGLILVLFTGAYALRANVINKQAEQLAIREQSRGEVELLGSAVRLGLTGSRGLVTCMLWNSAFEAQKKNQWNELELTVRALTRLQPHFIAPWLFQSWNLAYNVSVEADRPRDKYFYIARGIELLARGERQNANQPDLRWSIGFYTQHKIGRSDETNYQRSVFQLSTIPPNERDPARFWIPGDKGVAAKFNYVEFEKFCRDYPQLIRRLREGMHRDNKNERKRLFTCETERQVVEFLEDNYTVPGLYRTEALRDPSDRRAWLPNAAGDVLLPELDRFPALPARVAETGWQTSGSKLGDETDAFLVAGSWFAYSCEPIPAPDDLPGSTKPITDRAHQRRPKNITTLIFRNYSAQGRRYHAERLQEEGWYDEQPWDVTEWFSRAPDFSGRDVKVGGGRKWSQLAWQAAYQAWRAHGEDNKLLFASQEEEANMRAKAERFQKLVPPGPNGQPGAISPDRLASDPVLKDAQYAAKYIAELTFYRQVSNFMHHYNRCFVEQNPETVGCRKAFYGAEKLNFSGDPFQALRAYREPTADPAWGGQTLSPLVAWRDLVLKKNRDFRNDSFVQEATAEIQLRYQLLENRFEGQELKQKLAKASSVVPLLPPLNPESVPGPVTPGLYEIVDDEGKPYVPEAVFQQVVDRMNLPSRRSTKATTAGATPPPPPSLTLPKDR